jgi:hypothetical protein
VTRDERRPFDLRAFWALLAALSFAGLPLTGLQTHRLAFGPFTVERHAWMAAHDLLALAFAVAAAAHVALHRRALLRHARALARRGPGLSREAWLALALTSTLLLAAAGHAHLAGDRSAAAGGLHTGPGESARVRP